jgi:hypothetical protein
MAADRELVRFVRALLRAGEARREGEVFTARRATANIASVAILAKAGVIDLEGDVCRINDRTTEWLRKVLLAKNAVPAKAAARRLMAGSINRNESPLSRLLAADPDFLSSHHVETAERVRALVERAQLLHRTTMSYTPVVTGKTNAHGSADVSDLAIDARKKISDIYALLPRDCAGAIVDVCGFMKGLHQLESERGWPRRSAKIVLRIGLEQLAQHYGIGEVAIGRSRASTNGWMEEGGRPQMWVG